MNSVKIGMDEAGRGPVFGPMVVCAAALVRGTEDDIRSLGARDSKQLSPARRKAIMDKLSGFMTWEVRVVSAEEIDSRPGTMNELETAVFTETLNRLLDRIEGDVVVYLDAADVKEARFSDHIGKGVSRKGIRFISEHGADAKYPVVGAASIIAKVTRDEAVETIAQELKKKLNMPLGSGYPSDPRTKAFLREYMKRYGPDVPHVRKTWKTYKNLLNELYPGGSGGQTKLSDFGR